MCGFVGILKTKGDARKKREQALKMSAKIRHRGPDWSGVYSSETAVLAHERLAIVDPLSGGQPLYSTDGKVVLAVNGEIYNHQEIRRRYAGQYEFKTGSDCEVILALYREKGIMRSAASSRSYFTTQRQTTIWWLVTPSALYLYI